MVAVPCQLVGDAATLYFHGTSSGADKESTAANPCVRKLLRGRARPSIVALKFVQVLGLLIPTEAATFNEMMSPLITR